MNYQRLFLSGIFLSLFMLSASAKTFIIGNDSTTVRTSDTDYADEKVQADLSYNYKNEFVDSDYNRWQLRFQIELGF